jgi:hypothetical protein
MENLFSIKLHLNLSKKLIDCYIWSKALYCAESGTLQKVDYIYLESSGMWYWRMMEKIRLTDRVKIEEMLHRV